MEYYEQYVKDNTRKGNRHLANSFTQFKLFIGNDFISPTAITENFCKRFRQFLMDKFNGETPKDYYSRFKWALNAAEADKYFQKSPSANVLSKSKPSVRLKENLEVPDYLKLLRTPCHNEEVRAGAIFSCYTGLRWCDVKKMEFSDLRNDLLTTRIIQAKTGQPVVLTLHPIALAIIEQQRQKAYLMEGESNVVFRLPSANGANKIVGQWVADAGIEKYITWSCFRLSFSILLQDENVDDATVACLLGHTTTTQVRKVYRRHRPKDQSDVIRKLPSPDGQSQSTRIEYI
ncbi:site-specific integrase [Niabella sp. W65]|nr:site-specific integrase [Niabella sp. W65]MCH7366421.1 site-specific integrase [Niabella sp. W65]ULT42140.1 site-specific integrase [Niabella sp. I65]